jgi:hypothetical protein
MSLTFRPSFFQKKMKFFSAISLLTVLAAKQLNVL